MLPKACDRGTKCNAQGYKISWNGYKLHLDTADCGVVVSALLTTTRAGARKLSLTRRRSSAARNTARLSA